MGSYRTRIVSIIETRKASLSEDLQLKLPFYIPFGEINQRVIEDQRSRQMEGGEKSHFKLHRLMKLEHLVFITLSI